LHHHIKDILEYKEWTRFSQLYHFALKVEREIQGQRQRQNFSSNAGRSFQQHSDFDKPKALVAKPPATPPAATTPISEVSNVSSMQPQHQKKVVSTSASSSRSTNIVCHRCKGMGHVMNDCPSRRAFIATNDGGYVSASDVEDDLALAANHVADSESEEEAIDPMTAAAGYKSILVQRVLSTQLEHEPEKLQRHNLFNMFLIVKDCRVRTIIDSVSCNNLVSSDLVKKLGLTTYAHPKPYHLDFDW
jgi:hypothetical protein